MRRARGEEGIALVSAIIIVLVVLGLGSGLLAYANGQQRASYNEQSSESAYSLAEAALNAQIERLALQWPTSATGVSYPSSCNAASGGTGYCPSSGDLSAYSTHATSCPAGTQGDAWNSGSPSDGWTTYVRDAGSTSTSQQLFSSTTEKTASSYDASLNGYLWVRAVGIINCHMAVVVSRVSAQYVALNIPNDVINANGFQTDNSGGGSNYIVETGSGSAGLIQLRCTGLGTSVAQGSKCADYQNSAQVGPSLPQYDPSLATSALTATQLISLKAQAIANGTYWPANSCPSSSQLSGSVVYVTGPCSITVSGGGTINTSTSPGILVIDNGTFEITGSSTYNGIVYGVNAQGCPTPTAGGSCTGSNGTSVVYVHGNGTIDGGIIVDGSGTVDAGESHQDNIAYSAVAFNNLKTWGGAAGTPNTFRQLPSTQ